MLVEKKIIIKKYKNTTLSRRRVWSTGNKTKNEHCFQTRKTHDPTRDETFSGHAIRGKSNEIRRSETHTVTRRVPVDAAFELSSGGDSLTIIYYCDNHMYYYNWNKFTLSDTLVYFFGNPFNVLKMLMKKIGEIIIPRVYSIWNFAYLLEMLIFSN